MGRQAAGVRGMKLGSGDSIVGAGIVPKDALRPSSAMADILAQCERAGALPLAA
jgi:hypothetical protein